ncbi:MAG: hypothetical protein JWM95_785 [Gemmatimonadetes bacterium]|nr:hypothetical protein [Gemmatimonadota bacterium]
MPHTLPPYAIPAPTFRFWHLANLAGRAPIGGAREVALACFVAARLAADSVVTLEEAGPARVARCAGAKAWFGTLALPPAVRTHAIKCAELSVDAGAALLGQELGGLTLAASPYLDGPSRGELDSLASTLRDV